ncbi:hypothetical protein CCR94_00470 [Rhodoblastus sphagnicola]|uniref:histidine kinase n=1 Tax=Rhodoblastus sphagnicola TaxID=333368 RepID=A0A2S6NGZ7_9HYPH|nr:ATP-binding protein [Rhodoblastus sphagnicola]MBB4200311.1 signal transduction histidine kinase [Rhodoblastus sphagnicola]PPQ33925.1 hypothetical protein CCR94_00470 [Rhodoblastus sphagnicola]
MRRQSALHHPTQSSAERSNPRFTLDLALEDRRLKPTVATAWRRVLQEAIINIVRRAAATRVGVALEASDAEVKMIIEDKGRGFSRDIEPAGAPTKDVESTPVQGRALFVPVSP